MSLCNWPPIKRDAFLQHIYADVATYHHCFTSCFAKTCEAGDAEIIIQQRVAKSRLYRL